MYHEAVYQSYCLVDTLYSPLRVAATHYVKNWTLCTTFADQILAVYIKICHSHISKLPPAGLKGVLGITVTLCGKQPGLQPGQHNV